MVRVPRAEVDFPTEFTLSAAEFASILQAGGVTIRPSDETPDFHRMWERLIVQYVERATFQWPDYRPLVEQLEGFKRAATKGERAFATAITVADLAAVDPSVAPGSAGHVRHRPAHIEEALDIVEPELVRQLGDQWRAFLHEGRLDLHAVRNLLRVRIAEYKKVHGTPGHGRERQPDLEWFIDQIADLCVALGINVAANGRERAGREEGTTEYYRGGPFVAIVEQALGIATGHAARLGVILPATGNLPELVHGVTTKRRKMSKR